jgi:membrane protein implicated in regulation of membrane protease activity
MQYLLSNLAQSFIVVGLIFLAIEVLVLGFSTFVLIFVGVGMIVTGIAMATAMVPATLPSALLVTAIISTLVALVSWKPMKRMQNKVEVKQATNDIIGYRFVLSEDLPFGKTVTYRYSGIVWQVKAKQPLAVGTEVQIVHMEVGVLTVEPVMTSS